jgi:hypothetical protein
VHLTLIQRNFFFPLSRRRKIKSVNGKKHVGQYHGDFSSACLFWFTASLLPLVNQKKVSRERGGRGGLKRKKSFAFSSLTNIKERNKVFQKFP